jgi:predicted acylesterase/phospholipase RssA
MIHAPAPVRKCDIVMKGGVTSGLVYPRAIARLARHYRFHSIGGTSAGAIAAALTAAAEYRRSRGEFVFDQLAELPAWLGSPCAAGPGANLFNLFQPQKQMRRLFRIAAALLVKSWPRRMAQIGLASWPELILGAVPGLLVIALAGTTHALAGSLLGIFIALAGALVAGLAGAILRCFKLPRAHFGLCTGYEPPRAGKPEALIEWLNNRINSLAGRPPEQPLTFGDLRRAGINLQMITTALTFGRPYALPFHAAEFYFSPDEMRRYFPPEIVSWMERHPCPHSTHGDRVELDGLKPLPAADDLPVIVAARLSLGFPVLFTAVPLYAIDWTRRRKTPSEPPTSQRAPGGALEHDEPRRPEPVWFSDGGLCSNFPLFLFDAPIPRWPTFGIDLDELRPDRDSDADRVWMPQTNRSGIAHRWKRFHSASGFLAAVVSAAQNWTDALQTMVPGYRDRIAHIYLDRHEGGLNLNMPRHRVERIASYGERAADKLIERFIYGADGGKPTPMTWDNQRWIRYRSTMAVLEDFLSAFQRALDETQPGDRSYRELIARPPGAPPASYPFTAAQQTYAESITARLHDLGRESAARELSQGAPRPTPALRVRPQF